MKTVLKDPIAKFEGNNGIIVDEIIVHGSRQMERWVDLDAPDKSDPTFYVYDIGTKDLLAVQKMDGLGVALDVLMAG